MLSRFVIAFLPRSKSLLISWLQSSSTVTLEPKKIKSVTAYNFSPSNCYEVMGSDAMIIVFWMLSFKSICHCPPSPSSRDSLVTLLFLPLEWYYLNIWSCWYFSWQSWFQLVIHPTQHFTWCVMYSTYNLNKQSDHIQLDVLLSQFWTGLLFHVQFCCFLTCMQVSHEAGKVY